MTPKSFFSFEQMLTSFAYSFTGTATTVGGDDSVAWGTRKKQKKTKEEATAKGEKRSPAPPQTPPRPPRRRGGPSSLPQPDAAAVGDGTTAAESAATTRETTAAEALASTFATVEDEQLRQQRRELVVTPAGRGTPLVLPPDKGKHKNRGSSSSHLRKAVDGKPATFSRFFLPHHASASPGGEGKAGEARREDEQIEHVEEAGEEGKDSPFPDGENKRNQIDATNKRKKRRKRSCGDASRPPDKNNVGGDGERKSKRKKVVVVSPYFTAASSDQRVLEGAAGVEDEVEMVVQRRTKKKRTSQVVESAAEPGTSSGRHQGSLKAVDGKKKRKSRHQSVQLTAAERMADAYKRVPDDNSWVPLFSEHELLQELHFFDHWRVLVICMLLNRTTGREVQKVLPRLFLLCPDAETTMKVSEEEIEEIIRPLGLQKKRSKMIKRMSEEYLQPEWTHVTQLHGIGKYAADAYAIFCSGMWKEVKPNDHKLVDYWRFLLNDKDARESIMVQKSTRCQLCDRSLCT